MTYALPSCFSEPSSSSPLLLLLFYPHCNAGSFFINLSLPHLQFSVPLIFYVITVSVRWLSESSRNQSAEMEMCNLSILVVLTTLFHLLKIYSVEWEGEFA